MDKREELVERVAGIIDEYGKGLVPELRIVTNWLSAHFRRDPDVRAALSTSRDGWQPIETAPLDGLIDVWVTCSGGYRLADCYYDSICGEWRTSRPAGKLVSIPERRVSHWQKRPEAPSDAALSRLSSGEL